MLKTAAPSPSTEKSALSLVTERPRATRIAFADALRATAILLVVVNHFGLRTHVEVFGHGLGMAYLGVWGVDCFFVLTGYLLSKPYLSALIEGSQLPSAATFYSRRFWRIYPLYFVALCASIALAFGSPVRPTAPDIIAHLTMTHGLFPQYISQLNPPLWTMSVDAQFYLLLPIVAFVAALGLRGLPKPARVRAIWIALGCIVVLSLIARYLLVRSVAGHYEDVDYMYVFSRNVIGMGSEFAIGFALAYHEMYPIVRRPSWPSKAFYTALIVVAGLLLLSLVPLEAATRNLRTAVIANTIVDVVGGVSAGMLLVAMSRGGFDWIGKTVSSRVVMGIAVLAYGVYLFHDLFISHVAPLFGSKLVNPLHAVLFALLMMIPIFATAFVAHVLIEKRFMAVRDRRRERPQPLSRTRDTV